MKPSGTSLHKLAAQFVKHKRAGAPVCRPQTGRTEFASHKLGRPACSLSPAQGGWRLAILGLGGFNVAQSKPCRSPANGPRPTAQLATRDSSREHSSLFCSCWPTMCSCQEVCQVVELGRLLGSPEAGGCATSSGRMCTPGHAPAAEGPCPQKMKWKM